MIKGAYSDKYKAAQDEHIKRLKEQARVEGKNIQDRVKELSKETNRRRRALENKKRQLEEEEEKQREEVLAQRRKLKDEATLKFQKESLHKKKARPTSGKESSQTGSPQLQDGVRIVRGHMVELKNGHQITRAVPTLEDALKLVNSPYQDLVGNEIQYYGPKEMYQDLGDDYSKSGSLKPIYMNKGLTGTVTSLSGVMNPYTYDGDSLVSTSSHGDQGIYSNHDNDMYDMDHEEQIRLRESALQSGGPKFAFSNEEWTDGALPKTMGRDSPAGSLTSLDSLDEVPSDNFMTKDMTSQASPVTGIILKDNRTKSATTRRRVTFSDSIEFDDGLTGQLVTAEKASCKEYVKLYNSRIAASNALNGSTGDAPRPTGPIVKGVHTGGVVGTPGNTPMKNNGAPSSVSLQSGSSASMIVPKSIYSQIPFSGNKSVATTGEVTCSSTTHTDHPAQCVAQVEASSPSIPRPHGQYSTSGQGIRKVDEYQSNVNELNEESGSLEVKDSLDVIRDSLECAKDQVSHQQKTYESKSAPITYKPNKEDSLEGRNIERDREFEPPTLEKATQDEFRHVDYYGNPSNMHRNPFGQKISTEEASQTFNATTASKSTGTPFAQSCPTSSGNTHALVSGWSGQLVGASQGDKWEQDQSYAQEKIAKTSSKDSISSGNDSKAVVKNVTYYRSWYPGSFFPSKTHEERDAVMNDGDDEDVFEQPEYTKKNNSVAYDLMDEQEGLKKPPVQRKIVSDSPKTNEKNRNISYSRRNTGQETRDKDRYGIADSGTGYPIRNQQLDYTTNEDDLASRKDSTRTASTLQSTGYPTTTTEANAQKDVQPAGQEMGMTAKPPPASTRHKGVVYSSPLHRKRAAAAIRRHAGKISPRSAGRKTNRVVAKKKDDSPRRIAENQKKSSSSSKNGRKTGKKEIPHSESDDDEMIQSIKRDMERISMRCNSSPAQEEHQKIMHSISVRGQVDSPLGVQTLDKTDMNSNDVDTKSDFRTVYRKVHQPRVGSAKPRGQKGASNKVPPSKIPTYIGTSRNGPTKVGEGASSTSSNQTIHTTPTRWAEQGVSPNTNNELLHLQTTNLKRSISLDKTPTDDEINILWDRVRNCLNHKETQSVGSDSCVNRIDVRRSQARQFVPQVSQDNTLGDADIYRDRSASIAGAGTIGGLRRYGSYEALRRYGSADNLGCRAQPLLQHRAQRIRQSGQGKPPMVPRQQMSFNPMASRQAPTVSLSTRAAPIPLTQKELRAVMKASQQTQDHLFRQHYETNPEQTQGYQPIINTRKAPSALSIEEHRLLESLDRLNERLKVQEAITANLTHKRSHSANPSTRSRPGTKYQQASSSAYKYN